MVEATTPPTPPRRRSVVVRVLLGLLWTLVSLLALVGSLSFHLSLPQARSLARILIEDLASDALRGDIEVGRVDELGLGRAQFTDVVIRDPQGRVIIHAMHVTAWPDLWRLLEDGTIRIAGGLVEDAEVILYVEGKDGLEVSLVQAFQPIPTGPPNPNSEPVHILIDGLRVRRALVHGDVPRYPGLRMEDTDVYGRIDIQGDVLLQVFEGTAGMTGPYDGRTEVERMVVSFTTARPDGLTAYAEASRGPTHARARALVTWPDHDPEHPDEDTDPHIVITASAEPVCTDTLAEMGFPGLDQLTGCAEGFLTLEGPPGLLVLTSTLRTDAGWLDATGLLPEDGRYVFELRTHEEGLRLQDLVPTAPAILFHGHARVELEPDPEVPTRARFEVESEPLRLGEYDVPAFTARGSVEDARVVLDEVISPHLGSIAGSGTVGYDGAITVHVELDVDDAGNDPNLARLVPGLHGPTRGSLDIETTPRAEELDVRWDLVIAPFRYGPVRASRLATTGRAHGRPSALHVDAEARADGTVASGLRLGHVTGDIHGGASDYRIRARSEGGADIRQARTVLDMALRGGAIELTLNEVAGDFGFGMLTDRAHPEDGTAAADVPPGRIRVVGSRFELENIELVGGGHRVAARGTLDVRGSHSDLHVEGEGVQMALLRPFLPERFSQLAGTASATLDLAGSLNDPDVSLSGGVVDATLDGRRMFALHFRLEYSAGGLYAHVDGDLGDTGSLRLDGPMAISWAALTDPDRILSEARFDDFEIDVDRVNIAFVTPFLGENVQALGAAGKITVAMRVDGTLADLDVPWAVVILDNFALPNTSTVRAKIEGSLDGGVLTLQQLWLADQSGELARASALLTLPLDAMPDTAPAWVQRIAELPWQLRIDVAERRLEGWPRPLAKFLPRGVLFGGMAELRGDSEGVVAHAEGRLTYDEAATDAACAADLRPSLELVADTGVDGITVGSLVARLDDVVVASGTTRSPTPIADWLLAGVQPVTPTTAVDMHIDGLTLERTPWTCDRLSGDVVGDMSMTLFDPQPDLAAELTITGLRARSDEMSAPSAAYHAAIRMGTTGEGTVPLETCMILGREDGRRTPLSSCPSAASLRSAPAGAIAEDGEMISVVVVPVTMSEGAVAPAVAWSESFFAMLDAQSAQMEPLLVWIPGIADADATADGTVWAEGAWDSMGLEGGLSLRDGEARIISMGQYLHDLGGPLRFSGNRIVIPEDRPLEAWDGDHVVRVHGEVGMRGLMPESARLEISPTSFPIRTEGAILAQLTGRAGLEATIYDDRLDATLTVRSLTVELPQSTVGSVQNLALLPEVLVIGEDDPALARRGQIDFPYHVHVIAERAFTVRRNDFEAQLTADLDVTYRDPDLILSGVAVIQRGTFEVLGKRFSLARGSLSFDGGTELDPAIDVVAVYDIPGRSGATISVIVSGTLTDIHIDFQSTETSDTGEILALLVSGRASRATDPAAAQQAGEQTANFVSGLLAGVLTLGLREQFGSVVPNISLETGGRGSVAARVGFDADWIIPDFLRDVVLGAYFEGTVGSDTRTGVGSGGVGLGVTVELQFPYNFVGSGSYLYPSNGGLDLLWDAF